MDDRSSYDKNFFEGIKNLSKSLQNDFIKQNLAGLEDKARLEAEALVNNEIAEEAVKANDAEAPNGPPIKARKVRSRFSRKKKNDAATPDQD